ncbi:MAG: hypothetical protein M3315_04380 [Actinomycetota bacterium]|nr:hypothetical protein [Actinomycetota bacterium]
MRNSDRTGEAGWQLSPAARRRVMRAAFLRPWGLLVVVIGLVFFATTLVWWVVPLTLATYAALVLLAARDPLLKSRTLERWESQSRTQLGSSTDRDISPERRARWLPRGETRRKVEATLEIYQRTMVAIEESGDVARTVLDDTVPKLRRIAERLVDIAEKREKAADAIRELDSVYTSPRQREGRDVDLGELKEEIRAADAEISHILKQLTILQIRLVRLSVESRGKVRDAAADVSTDLDEINLRLDALHTTVSPPRAPDR